jgi:hypothetical protein
MTDSSLAQAVITEMLRINDPATTSATWPRVLEAINTNPRPFAHALGLLTAAPRQGRRVH